MTIYVPTLDDVKGFFQQLVSEATRCTQQMDPSEFDRYRRDVLDHRWKIVLSLGSSGEDQGESQYVGANWGYGIWRLQVNQSVSLIQAPMEVAIEKHKDGQEGEIKGRIKSFFQPLADLVPSEASTSLLFTFSPLREVGPSVRFDCRVQGIVVSATPAGN
jgi:hypothetical protein